MTSACERYRDDLVAEACRALPEEESRALRRHVSACPACRAALDRLRAALRPLALYEVERAPRLVEYTKRRVARRMTMRLPRPARLSRPQVLRVAMAAAVLLCFVTAFVAPILHRAYQAEPRDRTAAQLRGLYQGVNGYAQAYDGWLPPATGWFEAIRPFMTSTEDAQDTVGALSENYVFLQGLRNWFLGVGPGDFLFVARHKGPNDHFGAVTRAGSVELLSETRAGLLLRFGPDGTFRGNPSEE